MENATKESFVLAALETYECRLVRYAQRLLSGDTESARDAVQQTFLKLCQQEPQSVKPKLAPWLFTVCRNCALDSKRKLNKRPPADNNRVEQLVSPELNPSEINEQSELFSLLQLFIDQLPDNEREIIDLWSQSFTHREIAAITNQKEGTVRVQLHRSVQRLKRSPAITDYLNDTMRC